MLESPGSELPWQRQIFSYYYDLFFFKEILTFSHPMQKLWYTRRKNQVTLQPLLLQRILHCYQKYAAVSHCENSNCSVSNLEKKIKWKHPSTMHFFSFFFSPSLTAPGEENILSINRSDSSEGNKPVSWPLLNTQDLVLLIRESITCTCHGKTNQ